MRAGPSTDASPSHRSSSECSPIAAATREAARFIAVHADADIALGDVADHVGYSPFHLARSFERELGVPQASSSLPSASSSPSDFSSKATTGSLTSVPRWAMAPSVPSPAALRPRSARPRPSFVACLSRWSHLRHRSPKLAGFPQAG